MSDTRPALHTPEGLAASAAVVGGLVVVVGSFLPWATASAPLIGTISKSGIDGDGKISLFAGLAAIVLGIALYLGVASLSRTTAGWLLAIAAVLSAAVGVIDFIDTGHRISDLQAESDLVIASVGAGLYVLIVGALVLGLSAWVAFSGWTPQRAAAGNPPTPPGPSAAPPPPPPTPPIPPTPGI